MNLFIPTVGTLITLEKDWEFDFSANYKNYKFWQCAFPQEAKGVVNRWGGVGNPFYAKPLRKFALLRGTVLKIEKVSVTKHKNGNEVIFSIRYDAREEILKKVKVVVTLTEANKIICELGDGQAEKI